LVNLGQGCENPLFHYDISLGQAEPLERAPRRAVHERIALISRRKRALDIAGAVFGLAFLAPLLVAAALAIRLESRGPILFRQRRGGAGGRPFEILKFRTMSVLEDGDAIAHAKRGDLRITRVGSFLRRSSIDELPQLINVLRGEMSLVGPRPHALAHDRYYAPLVPGYHQRFDVKPGLTGLAQITGHRGDIADVAAMADRVKADLSYIETWSLQADCKILLLTAGKALFDPKAV